MSTDLDERTHTKHMPSAVPQLMEDLWRHVAEYCADDTDTLVHLGGVSRVTRAAVLDQPTVWRSKCELRWRQKWGFQKRWKKSLEDYNFAKSTNFRENSGDSSIIEEAFTIQNKINVTSGGRWWRRRYFFQEQDGRRSAISPEELGDLRFDFRFWLSQLWVNNALSTGLTWSSSLNFRFIHTGGRHGYLEGHPSRRDDLEWFLDPSGLTLAWGKLPHLWPEGSVHRLESWGWEIRNPNVCMRSIDFDSEEEKEERLDSYLWDDYIEAIERVEVDFGFGGRVRDHETAHLDAPLVFWDFELNRRRFPPCDKQILLTRRF